MPAQPRKRAADKTGRDMERLQEVRKTEIQEAAGRIAMVTASNAAAKDDIIDITGAEPLPQAVTQEVQVNSAFRIIRVNQDIDQMTFGRSVIDSGNYDDPNPANHRPAIMGPMNYHSFKEGQAYRVPAELAEHLDTLGYLSFMGRG